MTLGASAICSTTVTVHCSQTRSALFTKLAFECHSSSVTVGSVTVGSSHIMISFCDHWNGKRPFACLITARIGQNRAMPCRMHAHMTYCTHAPSTALTNYSAGILDILLCHHTARGSKTTKQTSSISRPLRGLEP